MGGLRSPFRTSIVFFDPSSRFGLLAEPARFSLRRPKIVCGFPLRCQARCHICWAENYRTYISQERDGRRNPRETLDLAKLQGEAQ